LMLEHLEKVTDLPKEDLYHIMKEWTFVPYVYGGRIAGTAIMSGTEVHFVMKDEFKIRAFQRHSARQFFEKLMRGKEYLTTRVPVSEEKELRFCTRLGFVETWRDENFVYLMMTTIPFEGKHHEQ